MEIKIGADPEFFLRSKTSGQFISAIGLVPGNKLNPFKVEAGAIQIDGTAVEFNIEPALTAKQFIDNIDKVLGYLRKNIPQDLEFQFLPSIKYDQPYFDMLPEDCKLLGCDPDYNAYTGKANPTPQPVGTMRTGSGHIHVGWTSGANVTDPDHIWDCKEVVKSLDATIGALSAFWDDDKERATMYGKPGAFRPKSYGVEYRTLSNAWLRYPKLWPWIFDATKFVVEKAAEGHLYRNGISPNISYSVTNAKIHKSHAEEANSLLTNYVSYKFPKLTQEMFKEARV